MEKKRARKDYITAVKIGLLVIKLIVLLIPMLLPALALNQLTLYTPDRVETVKVPISVCKETFVGNKYGFVHIGITWKVHHLEQAVLVSQAVNGVTRSEAFHGEDDPKVPDLATSPPVVNRTDTLVAKLVSHA